MRCLTTCFVTTLLLSSGVAFADIHKGVNDVRQNIQEEVVKDPQNDSVTNRNQQENLNTDRSVIDNKDALENQRNFDRENAKDLRDHDLNKEMKQDLEVDGSDGSETVEDEELLD